LNRLSDLLLDLTPPPPLEYLIGPVEAAEILHVSSDIVIFWATIHLIPAHQLRYDGKIAWRFKRSELANWRKQNPGYASPKGPRKLGTSKCKPSRAQRKRTSPQPNSSRSRKIS
jgi:hypothetical protein